MAKKRDPKTEDNPGAASAAGGDQPTDSKIEAFAEDLGRLLGQARAKADSWIGQRSEIQKHLTDVRDTANSLIERLGDEVRD